MTFNAVQFDARVVGGLDNAFQGAAFGAFQRFVTSGHWNSQSSNALAQQLAMSVVGAIPVIGSVVTAGIAISFMFDDGLPSWGERDADIDAALRMGVTPAALHDMRVYVHRDGNPQTTPYTHLAGLVGAPENRDKAVISYFWDKLALLPDQYGRGATLVDRNQNRAQNRMRAFDPHVAYTKGWLKGVLAEQRGTFPFWFKPYRVKYDGRQFDYYEEVHLRDNFRGELPATTAVGFPDAIAGFKDGYEASKLGQLRELRDLTEEESAQAKKEEAIRYYAEMAGIPLDVARAQAGVVSDPIAGPRSVSNVAADSAAGVSVESEASGFKTKAAVSALMALMFLRG